MDSLTQLTFGAACGEAILGQKVGRKALVWGAVLGTLPDLDVFIPLGGPVNDFVYHRGFSHSLTLLALLSPIMALVDYENTSGYEALLLRMGFTMPLLCWKPACCWIC